MELTIVSESATIVMNHNLTEWSSPSPKSGPLRPKPKPKAVPNPSPIGTGAYTTAPVGKP